MKNAFLLFDFLIILANEFVHLLHLAFQGRVEIIFDIVVTAFLEAFLLEPKSQFTPLMGVLFEENK